jgi:tripeptide aminopeptidase
MENNSKTELNALPNIPDKHYIEFAKLLRIQASSENEKLIYFYLRNWLIKRNITCETDNVGNILVTKGILEKDEFYPCVVSHMDTVHKIHKNFKVFYYVDKDGNTCFIAKSGDIQVGLGSDDKNGIYACLYALETLPKVKIVFFTREEAGCIGSKDISLDFFKDVGYIIQLDRWGAHDLITSQGSGKTVSQLFLDKIKQSMKIFDYKEASGLSTDALTLFARKVGVCCVNISCGYYKHHSDKEFTDVNEFWNSLKFTSSIIQDLGQHKYDCLPEVKTYSKTSTKYYDYDDWEAEYFKPCIPKAPAINKTNYNSSFMHNISFDINWDIFFVAVQECGYTIEEVYSMAQYCPAAFEINNKYRELMKETLF